MSTAYYSRSFLVPPLCLFLMCRFMETEDLQILLQPSQTHSQRIASLVSRDCCLLRLLILLPADLIVISSQLWAGGGRSEAEMFGMVQKLLVIFLALSSSFQLVMAATLSSNCRLCSIDLWQSAFSWLQRVKSWEQANCQSQPNSKLFPKQIIDNIIICKAHWGWPIFAERWMAQPRREDKAQ